MILIVELLVLVGKPLHCAEKLRVGLVHVWRGASLLIELHWVGQAWHPVRLSSHSYQRVLAHALPAELVASLHLGYALHRVCVEEKLRVVPALAEPKHTVSWIPVGMWSIGPHADAFEI